MNLKNIIIKCLLEAPISNFERIGEWEQGDKPRGWDKASRGILTSPVGVEKIKTLWSKLPEDVDMYLVSNKEGWKHTEVGEVDENWVKDNLKLNLPINHDNITVIYTNNKGSEKVPATGWTLAHRFGHALRRSKGFLNHGRKTEYGLVEDNVQQLISKIADKIYRSNVKQNYGEYDRRKDKIKLEVAHALGTFKSARDKNLRNDAEFTNELIAQYIVTGNIKFNRELPNLLALRYTWGHPQGVYKKHNIEEQEKNEIEQLIYDYENSIRYGIEDLIANAVGKIFVM
jgi:hypothetical protein